MLVDLQCKVECHQNLRLPTTIAHKDLEANPFTSLRWIPVICRHTIPPLERAAARRRAHEVAPPHYSSTTRMVRRLI